MALTLYLRKGLGHQASRSCALTLFLSKGAIRSFSSKQEAVFDIPKPFKLFKLDKGPDTKVKSSKQELLNFYRVMQYYRRFEITCDLLYKSRQIRGFCHLYDGQEAITCGMEASLQPGDSIISAYRDHVTFMGRGGSGESCMAELMGKYSGCTKGKGGSMHMYYPQNHFYGGNGIVGAQVPVGAGLAFAHKYRGDGKIAVAMMGDGAANQGQVYEAANMASLWKLPCIFLIENNKYGMGTSTARAAANPEFYTRGAYIPGIWIDGLDVLAVKQGIAFAAEHCRSGKGPLFVELETYRYHGHSMSDPGISYRERDEIAQMRNEFDCILRVKSRLLEKGWATEKELQDIDNETRKQIDEVVEAAKKAEAPPNSQLYADIYVGAPPPFIRAVEYEKSVTNN